VYFALGGCFGNQIRPTPNSEYTGDSQRPGDDYAGESQLPGDEYTEESRLPASECTGESRLLKAIVKCLFFSWA
jgi:hypothetical protein